MNVWNYNDETDCVTLDEGYGAFPMFFVARVIVKKFDRNDASTMRRVKRAVAALNMHEQREAQVGHAVKTDEAPE